MYPFVTAIHMTANYLKWTLLLLHQKTASIKAGQKWYLLHEILWELWTSNCTWSLNLILRRPLTLLWSANDLLKWVKLIRVAEHFIKIENSPWWLGTTGTSLVKFPLAIFFLHLFTFLFQWNCSAVSRSRILSDLLYYRKQWFCIWSDANKHFCHCITKPSYF